VANKRQAATGRTVQPQQQLSVLLIAPDTDLPNADAEQQRIINALHPQVLLDDVTTGGVLDAIQGGAFDVVWFLGHSGPAGLQLSDGVLSPSHLAQILRQSPPQLVVLNSCSSLHIAMQVHDDLQCQVICTVLDIPDLDAYITGASLANALAAGNEIPDAYNVSRPSCVRQYVLLNGSVRLNGDTEIDDVHRLVLRTYADLQHEIAGVRAEQVRVREEVLAGHERYQPRSTGARAAAWLLGALLMIAAAGLIDFRAALGVPTVAATLMAAFISLVALWLAVWGLGFRLDKW
jgi:hypothetical protein